MKYNVVNPVVSILFDKRGDPPYVSSGKLWNETIDIISDNKQKLIKFYGYI